MHEFRQAPAIKFGLPLCQMRTAETMQTVGTHQEETCAALLLYTLYQDKKEGRVLLLHDGIPITEPVSPDTFSANWILANKYPIIYHNILCTHLFPKTQSVYLFMQCILKNYLKATQL